MSPYKRLINGIKNLLNPTPPSPEEIPIVPVESAPSPVFTQSPAQPIRISRSQHSLSRKAISKSALKVLYELHDAGYQAFLVGGGVRDVLLGRSPKDFDVATNALPEEIKKLFRNCRLIGRRFVLAHVYFGREIVEVATFRAHDNKEGDRLLQDGRILRDNVYGTIDEDAWRRDFTINALYYDINDFSLLDYVDGLNDLHKGIIRLIGDPIVRYQEDPVRMLRAIRFSAKLGFDIHQSTADPIFTMGELLADIPPARLYEEVLKLFLCGHGLESFYQLRRYQLFHQLMPQTENCLTESVALALIENALKNTDERVVNNQPVTPAFLFAAFLWTPLMRLIPEFLEKGLSEQDSLLSASHRLLNKHLSNVAIPRRISALMEDIWLMQGRLTRVKLKQRARAIEHPRFRAGFDFLALRAAAGEPLEPLVTWWTEFQGKDEAGRHAMIYPPRQSKRPNKRRSRRKKPTPSPSPTSDE